MTRAKKISQPKRAEKTLDLYKRIEEKLRSRGITPNYGALRKRVNDIIKEVEDIDEIELVLYTLIDDSHEDFASWKDFNWLSYERSKESLEVPDGAWRFALWSYTLQNPKVRDSVNYWLGEWYDAAEDWDQEKIDNAKYKLELLWLNTEVVEEVKW